MRKLLMASAAILGAAGGLAQAQIAAPTAPSQTFAPPPPPQTFAPPPPPAAPAPPRANPLQGQLAAPYGAGPAANNNNNAWGIANTPTGAAAAGPLSTIYAPNVDAVPAPGTVVIRLNGRVEVDVSAVYTSVDRGVNPNGTANGFKLNPVGIGSYMRLYPAFDGLAANGLRYGASVELRENFYGGTTGTGTPFGVTSPSGNSSAETVFVRRAFTYLASDSVGIVRLGQTDGVLGLFDNCIFTTQCWDSGVGNFNGGAMQSSGPSGTTPPFVWLTQAGAEYGNSKIVYLSPQFFGFDFGVQYAPNQGNSFGMGSPSSPLQGTVCNQANANCISVSSGDNATRWINQVGVGVRYSQVFGPVDFKAYGFYETAGKEQLTATIASTPAINGYQPITRTGNPAAFRYNNLSFVSAGAALTFANFTLAGDYIGGKVNGQLNMQPRGGRPTNAVVTGLTYANGPIILGAEVGIIDTQGDARLTGVSQRHEFEVAFGGSYKLAPGLNLVAEYMYEERHQGGFDFNTGALGNPSATGAAATAGTITRDARAQGFTFATVLTW